ncbi:uncharacterized protein ARMOST_19276 [Armillaria ostoyae]|uniref:Mid2 domain-containing protein n=1 Tax=Armillaria ostoyae TaxID=47428 RepID=A0A284S438_ARMOS|nr:uncharacterized protein ARMOST_19276 [Armillaria ostoyae]
MCPTSTTESGPKGIGDLSCALGLLVQGHPKTSGLKCHSSLPSASPSAPATFSSRPARIRSPSFPLKFSFPFPPPQDTSATSTSSSRSTVFSTTNLATSTTSNGPLVVTSNFIHPFTLTTPSPLPSTKTIFFTKTVTEPPVTRTKDVFITSFATTTTTLQSTIIKAFTEIITDTTTLPPTTYTEVRVITSKETETTTITQPGTITPTATSTHSSQQDRVNMVALVGGISSIVLVMLVLIALLVLLCLCLYRRRKKSGASDFLKIPPSSITRPSRSHARPSSSTSLASVRSRDDPYPRTIRHDGRASQVSMMPNGDLPIGPSVAEYRHPNKTFTGPVDVDGVYGYSGEGSREVSTLPSRFSETTVSSTGRLRTRVKSLWSVFRIRGLERKDSVASLA